MICSKCGAQIEPGSEFCDQCGAPLNKKKGKKKKSRLALVLVMLFLILAAAGGVTLWIVTDEHHTIAEIEERYQSVVELMAAEENKAVREEELTEEENDSISDGKEQFVTDENPETEASAEVKDEEDTEKSEDDYILPESNSRYLTDADIAGLSLQEINYAKNEIYARLGRKFDSQELQNYFNSKSWYVGRYDPSDFDSNYAGTMNDYEKKNAEFLSEKEFSISPDGYKLDAN